MTSIDKHLQENSQRIAKEYHNILEINRINNIAAIIIDVKTNNILAYIGNSSFGRISDSPDVDIVKSPRSTGSIIKPLLYASMLQEGKILPTTLVPDIPTRISGFNPDNYDETYHGAVPAKQALSRSLNIPVVRMLQVFRLLKIYYTLKKLGYEYVELWSGTLWFNPCSWWSRRNPL
ncbi:MAG: hypothetical protein HC830_13015 [Bacteroidetes bacterium]|nr:hypothetical protein [Bacteroidota bacterium]